MSAHLEVVADPTGVVSGQFQGTAGGPSYEFAFRVALPAPLLAEAAALNVQPEALQSALAGIAADELATTLECALAAMRLSDRRTA